MSEIDPTRTRLLRDEYARALTRLTKTAMKRVIETLKSEPLNEQIIDNLQAIIEQDLGAAAKPIIDRITMLAYQRGTNYADRKLKAAGIQFSITRAAPELQFTVMKVKIPQNIAIVDPETLRLLKALNLDLVKKLSDEVKGRMASEIRQGLLRGEHPYRIAERLAAIGEMSKYRAETIARTETIRTFNTAAESRYRAAGAQKLKWLTGRDERVCSVCFPRDGQIYNIDDFPEIPAHPNCRCASVPVFED